MYTWIQTIEFGCNYPSNERKPDLMVFNNNQNAMTFTSKLDWDTNINALGGQNNILLVDSPYSDLPSANASQGALTYGNLVNEFAPPKIEISPIDNGYYIHSRMHTGILNPAVDIVGGALATTPAAVAKVEAAAAQAEAAAAPADGAAAPAADAAAPVEGGDAGAKPPAVPEQVQGKEGFRESMGGKRCVGPSRRGHKQTTNRPERGHILEDGVNRGAEAKESYVEMPEFVGSNIHMEEFSFKPMDTGAIIFIVVLSVVIVVGLGIGLWYYFSHKKGQVSNSTGLAGGNRRRY